MPISRVMLLATPMLMAAGICAILHGAPDARVSVKFFQGEVAIQNHGERRWSPLTLSSRVDGRSLIMTGAKSTVVLSVGDREVAVGESNTVRVGDLLARTGASHGGRSPSHIIHVLSRAFVRDEHRESRTEVIGVRGREDGSRGGVNWIEDDGQDDGGAGDQLATAHAHYGAGRYGECAAGLEKALASLDGARRREALRLLGMSWHGVGDFGRSADYLRKYLACEGAEGPDAASATFLLGMSLSFTGDYLGAAEQLERFVTRFPSDARVPDVSLLMGQFYGRGGRADRAAACYRRIMSAYPGTPAAADAKQEYDDMKR